MPRQPVSSRPLTRAQQLENAAFLRALRRTGTVRLAAREIGLAYGTIQHRRARHPAFAARWDAALVFAQARFNARGLAGPVGGTGPTLPIAPTPDEPVPSDGLAMPPAGRRRASREQLRCPRAPLPTPDEPVSSDGSASPPAGRRRASRGQPGCPRAHRTHGGEPVVVRRNDGQLQMRRALPGKLTKQCEQAFLAALSATANVRLSAAAAGAAAAAFYRRRRRDPGFAREWRLALQEGYERLEMALLEAGMPESFADDHWRHNDRPATPPMTANQALQLMYLHQKEARLWTTPAPDRLRPGETWEARSVMLGMIHEARQARDREAFRVAEAMRLARGEETVAEWGPGELPDLAQVTGWSKASGRPAFHDDVALFGGWRLGDLKGRGRK